MLHLHLTSVILFMLIYLFRFTALIITTGPLAELAKKKFFRIAPMVLSLIFLATGVFLITKTPMDTIGNFFWIKMIAVALSIPLAVIGFKKANKGLAGLSILLIVVAYGMAEMNKKNPAVAADLKSKSTGSDLFSSANCVLCHGSDGKLMASGSKDLTVSEKNQDEIQAIIRSGKGLMPSFSKKLTEEQIKELSQYVLDLRKK